MPRRGVAARLLDQIEEPGLSEVDLLRALLDPALRLKRRSLPEDLLDHFGSLYRLGRAVPEEFLAVPGVEKPTALRLAACFRLARLSRAEDRDARPLIQSPDQAAEHLYPIFDGQGQEQFRAMFLDSRHRLIKVVLVAQGSMNMAAVDPKDLLRSAIIASAADLVLAHNHPSGDPEPSDEDLRLTWRFDKACKLLGFGLLDHLVLGAGSHVSLQERGLMK